MKDPPFSGTRLAINVLVAGLVIAPLVYVAVWYPSLPDRIPVHWNARGDANGWARKSILTVFFPGVLALLVQTMLWLLVNDLVEAVHQVEGSDRAAIFKRESLAANLDLMQPMRVVLGCMLCVVALLLPATQQGGQTPEWMSTTILLCVAALIGSTIYGAVRILRTQRKWRAEASSSLPELQDANWRWGVIYYNKEDPAFLVQKRIGLGFTINCAHSRATLYSLLITAILAFTFVAVASMTSG